MPRIEIRIKDCLDPDWADWLGDLSIQHAEENQTLLTGHVEDQAALFGLLSRLRDLGLELISVKYGKEEHVNFQDHLRGE